jgi:TalC/MipB family fructose-6-phosphate aldolase
LERVLEIWLDTIDEDVIVEAVKTLPIAGVTTNPSILSTADNVLDAIQRLLEIQPGPVAVQVTAREAEVMVEEGLCIAALSPRIIIKVPINRDGLIAIHHLRKAEVSVMGTAVLFPAQALLACNHGVSYIAPYFSHMGLLGDAHAALKHMVAIAGGSSKILAASLKQIDQVIFCALQGVSAVTLKPDLYRQLVAHHPIVEGFIDKFSADWAHTHGDVSLVPYLMR